MNQLRRFFNRLITAGNNNWLFLIPSLLLVALFGLPILALLLRAINDDFLANALSSSSLAALRLSLITSLISVGVTIIFGTPLAYILARWKFFGKDFIQLLIDLPVVLPPSVAGLALLIVFGREGVFGSFLKTLGVSLPFTTAAVIIAQTFVSAPLYVRAARIGFAEVDIQMEEAARVEGANQWQVFREVMFPLAKRALTGGAILSWARALGEFGATILFAGNLEGVTQTMPLAIYIGFERNLGAAIAMSATLVGMSVLLLLLTRRLEKRQQANSN